MTTASPVRPLPRQHAGVDLDQDGQTVLVRGVSGVALGATVPVAVPAPVTLPPLGAWERLGIARGRRARLRRYARAMGWDLTPDGVLVGQVDGIGLRAHEDRGQTSVVAMTAPGLLPLLDLRPHSDPSPAGLRDVPTGDLVFDRRYVLRAVEPWFARAVVDSGVRRSLLAAPTQSWSTSGHELVSRSTSRLEPLDLLARVTALRTLILAVPWEAYPDPRTTPSPAAVQAALRARALRAPEFLPSAGRLG